jgi:chromosome segregation ATPase
MGAPNSSARPRNCANSSGLPEARLTLTEGFPLASNIKTTVPPSSSDLEETAELPQLSPPPVGSADPLSATDAWMAPAIDNDAVNTQTLPTLSSHRRGRDSNHEAEIGALRSDLASVSESRSQLERDIDSLSGNLRELEQLLNRKSEQLTVYEREVGQRDRRIAELEARAGQLDAELATRQSHYETELAARHARFDAELSALTQQRSEAQEQLGVARSDGEALRARADAQAAELTSLKAERTQLTQRYRAAETDLAQWRTRGERYRETLQGMEGRRQLYDGVVAEREARIAALEQAAAEHERRAGAREEGLQTAVRDHEERVRELDAARTRAEAATATARDRIVALETEIRQQEQQLRELRTRSQAREQSLGAELSAEQQRAAGLEKARAESAAAATAARERIAALEGETRASDASLTALRTQSEERLQTLQGQLAEQQRRIGELESARAEVEAAASTARARAEADAAAALQLIGELEERTRAQAENLTALSTQAQGAQRELQRALQAEQQRSADLDRARRAVESAAEAALTQAAADAASARERIALLEAENRQQAESLQELRAQLGAVRDSLAQRNALIERVEAEAASSVAMLGNIQHNLEHLGDEEQAHLLARTDGATGIIHLLGRRTTIGRTPDNDVRIDAEFISRHHAVALRAGAKTVIEDLNSTNGTYVNGQRVNRRTLKDGDLVTLGKTEFRFSISKAPVPAPA